MMLAVTHGATIKINDRDPREIDGYLVVFGTPQQTDLAGDYFDATTDFGPARETPVWLNHTLPIKSGVAVVHIEEPIGSGLIDVDERGVIIRALLDAKYRYLADIASDLGWSSGTAAHLVRRVQIGAAKHITRWPLGIDASLTPTPAEPRTMIVRPAAKTLVQWVEPTILVVHKKKEQ